MNKKEMLLKLIAELSLDDLQDIINDVDEKPAPVAEAPQKKRKQKRRGQKQVEEVAVVEEAPKRRKKKLILPGEENEPRQPTTNAAGAVIGPNKFDKMNDVHGLFKNETKWQKKVDPISQGKTKPAQRRQKVQLVDSQCLRCGRKKRVSPAFLIKDIDTKEVGFICQKCYRQGGKAD
jgi:hypothetical protein